MRQGIKNKAHAKTIIKENSPKNQSNNYGTSKLEQDFANDFLKKYNVDYIYQYHAKDINRYYDFFCPKTNSIIEIDGDYW